MKAPLWLTTQELVVKNHDNYKRPYLDGLTEEDGD